MFGYTFVSTVCFMCVWLRLIHRQVLRLKSSLQIHVNPEALIFCPPNHYSQNGLLLQAKGRKEKENGEIESESRFRNAYYYYYRCRLQCYRCSGDFLYAFNVGWPTTIVFSFLVWITGTFLYAVFLWALLNVSLSSHEMMFHV